MQFQPVAEHRVELAAEAAPLQAVGVRPDFVRVVHLPQGATAQQDVRFPDERGRWALRRARRLVASFLLLASWALWPLPIFVGLGGVLCQVNALAIQRASIGSCEIEAEVVLRYALRSVACGAVEQPSLVDLWVEFRKGLFTADRLRPTLRKVVHGLGTIWHSGSRAHELATDLLALLGVLPPDLVVHHSVDLADDEAVRDGRAPAIPGVDFAVGRVEYALDLLDDARGLRLEGHDRGGLAAAEAALQEAPGGIGRHVPVQRELPLPAQAENCFANLFAA
mmetsp:Transcript_43405/g.110494  ORF Transcript_43405/g.110494 Transcript_43405/m.110494 type:complete len:280 (-) Transcript_43405:528-1367(-)